MVRALFEAARDGDLEQLRAAMRNGASVNDATQKGLTVLMVAAHCGHEALVAELLAQGADVDARDGTGSSALLRSATLGHASVVRLLLEQGADLSAAKDTGTTALHRAAREGHTAIVALLVDRGMHVDCRNSWLATPLLLAATWGRAEVVQQLLDYGADLEATDLQGCTAVLRAAHWGRAGIMAVLIKAGANVNVQDRDGNSPLLLAARRGNADVVSMLIDAGADCPRSDADGDTPLVLAARSGHEDIMRLLLARQSDRGGFICDDPAEAPASAVGMETPTVELENQYELSGPPDPLDSELPDGEPVEIPNLSIDSCVVTYSFDSSFEGMGTDQEEVTSLLEESAVDLDEEAEVCDLVDSCSAPADTAVWADQREPACGPAQACSSQSKAVQVEGWEALIESAKTGHTNCAKVLLQQGLDPNVADSDGDTPLNFAVMYGHRQIVQLLLSVGASPDIPNDNGDTALILAARNNREDIAALLIDTEHKARAQWNQRDTRPNGEPPSIGNGAKPLLLAQLADFLIETLDDAIVEHMLERHAPEGARGTLRERMLETLFEHDLPEFLHDCLGEVGVLQALGQLGVRHDESCYEKPVHTLLAHFGILWVSDTLPDGPAAVMHELNVLCGRINNARDGESLMGAFLNVCLKVEQLLKMAVLGWAELAFSSGKGPVITEILQTSGRAAPDLEKLSFGHILWVFDKLPERIEHSDFAHVLEQKLGRRQIYSTRNQKTRFSERLEALVRERNALAHGRVDVQRRGVLGRLRRKYALITRDTEILIREMTEYHAVPRIATVVEETRDRVGRLGYRLVFDDGSSERIHRSTSLCFDNTYLYFGSHSNPRPVDPLMVSMKDIGRPA